MWSAFGLKIIKKLNQKIIRTGPYRQRPFELVTSKQTKDTDYYALVLSLSNAVGGEQKQNKNPSVVSVGYALYYHLVPECLIASSRTQVQIDNSFVKQNTGTL